MFGDGWAWGGCILLHLLGLRERFEYLDFTYFVMKLNAIDPAPVVVDPKTLKKNQKLTPEQELLPKIASFLQTGAYLRDLNNYIFSVLDSYMPIAPNAAMLYDRNAALQSGNLRSLQEVAQHRPTPSMGANVQARPPAESLSAMHVPAAPAVRAGT